jgi:hypothetical protein
MPFRASFMIPIAFSIMISGAAAATEGVKGAIVRPARVDAKVTNCKIAEPGDYEVAVGDLIELDYAFPVAIPGAGLAPKKVDSRLAPGGAVARSSLGVRSITTPGMVGGSAIAFFFEAKTEGTETVTLIIDGNEYTYKFTVRP